MIKKLIFLSALTTATKYLAAQSNNSAINIENSVAIWLILGIAVIALALSVINFFRLSYIKKIAEVDMVNQKDDLNVTIEAVKVAISKEIRYLRKEVSKSQRGPKPNDNQPKAAPKSENDAESIEKEPSEKKPFKKRTSNFKRRPPHKRPIDKDVDPTE